MCVSIMCMCSIYQEVKKWCNINVKTTGSVLYLLQCLIN